MKVLAFGEILWDIIEGDEHLGGAPFNFIAHIAQCGDPAFMISRLGQDHRGMKAFDLCKAHGVSERYIQWDDTYPTGIVDVTLTKGQPDYVIIEDVAWDAIAFTDELSDLGREMFDVFYYGSLAQRSKTSRDTLRKLLERERFRFVFFDVNLRRSGFTEAIIKDSLGYCSILKLNHEEVPVISTMLAGHALGNVEFCKCVTSLYPNVQHVVITAAEKGCYLYHQEHLHHIPGVRVTVADAVGAGDAFSAAFMHVFVRRCARRSKGRQPGWRLRRLAIRRYS